MSRVTDESDFTAPTNILPPNGKRIILAEDDPFISRMYDIKLTNAGYAVTVIANGRDAFEAIKATPPDMVVLDINMPELNGFEVVRALQGSDFDMKSTAIVILTNSASPADRQTATSLGIDYLVKAETTPRGVLEFINKKLGVGESKPEA